MIGLDLIGLVNRSVSIVPQLLASPLGYHADFDVEEIEHLAKHFTTMNVTPNMKFHTSAFCYVMSGSVNIVTTNLVDGSQRTVTKVSGDWVLTPSAVPEAEWQHNNYVWAYGSNVLDEIERERPSLVDTRSTRISRVSGLSDVGSRRSWVR